MDESIQHQEQQGSGQEAEHGTDQKTFDSNGNHHGRESSIQHNQAPPPAFDPDAIAAQLPPNFPRGDAAAMDAVMQLAQAASQQQHFNFNQHVASTGEENGQVEARSKRRRSSQTGARGDSLGTSSNAGAKLPRREEEASETNDGQSLNLNQNENSHQNMSQSHDQQDPNQNQTPWSPDYEQLLRRHLSQAQDEGMRDQSQQGEAGSGGSGESHEGHEAAVAAAAAAAASGAGNTSLDSLDDASAQTLARNGRALSNTKRAAQNRAAQRAFRERRDKYVKDVEAKAELLERTMASERHYKSQYEEALKTIEGLRADNQSLRLAINALGGQAPATQSNNAETTSAQPPARQEESENGGDQQRWEQVDPSLERQEAENAPEQGNNQSKEQEQRPPNEDGQLDGLRAVAAAAAAAVVSEDNNKDDSSKQGNES